MLRRRLLVAAVLTVPLALLAMVPPLQFSGLGVAGARAGDAGRALGGLAVPPRGAAEPAARRGDDGHADLARHAGGLGVVGGRARRLPREDIYFEVGAVIDDADPARPLPGGARQAPLARRGDPHAARARREGGAACSATAQEVAGAGRRAPRRRPLRCPARREDRDRRDRRGGRLGGRPVDADRRVRPGRGRARLRGRRSDDQHGRAPDRARDEGRRRHRARADRAPGRRGPGGKGADPAPRRPHLGGVRADRDRARALHARRLALASGASLRCVHGRRRGADHRLPVRAWPGHADRADGRNRPGRAARAS